MQKLIKEIDLVSLSKDIVEAEKNTKGVQKTQIIKKIRLVQSFLKSDVKPSSMFLNALPVMPDRKSVV